MPTHKSYTFAFLPTLNATKKMQKSMPYPTLKTDTDEGKPAENSRFAKAGVSCFVGQESDKFKVQFFVGSLVLNIPACV
jgi:hypothetical protein